MTRYVVTRLIAPTLIAAQANASEMVVLAPFATTTTIRLTIAIGNVMVAIAPSVNMGVIGPVTAGERMARAKAKLTRERKIGIGISRKPVRRRPTRMLLGQMMRKWMLIMMDL